MNITINPITNLKYEPSKNVSKNKLSENPSSENTTPLMSFCYRDLTFQSRYPQFHVKPVFKNPKLEALRDKITFYLNKFPAEAKMPKPTILKTETGNFAIKVDKTFKDGTKVYIRDLKGNTDISDWASLEKNCEGLEMMIDSKGQMTSASWCEPQGMNLLYERTKQTRRVRFGNYFYLPIANEEYLWKRMKEVPGMKPYYSASEKMDFRNSDLQVFFAELARKRASFLGN